MGESVPLNSRSAGACTTGRNSSLTPARWQQIKELFNEALEYGTDHRAEFLQQACGDDQELRTEVESLLASADSNGAVTSEVFKSVTPPGEHPPGETEDPLIGQRVGDYRIDQRIGFGGMAAVYLASRADEQFHMRAAIKLLRPDLNNTDLLHRFLKERQTLAALDHPNIVKLLDGGSTERGLPYLVMDYVEGQPIDEYCDDHNLSIQKRLQVFCTVCEAVEFAHKHRVIHRDLKPNNILVTADGVPKLLDFGIAKVLDPQNPAEVTVTRTAARHLTPAYASPEQVRGDGIAAATDVYSLGVVLYELLTGHRPYRLKQRTPAAMEHAICEEEPESPSTAVDRVESEIRPDGTVISVTAETVSRARETQPEKLRHCLKGDLDNIILKALQKEPLRRYQTVAELGRDIQRHLDHHPILARPSTLKYRASKFIRRHTTELASVSAVIVILAAALFFSIWEEHRATDRSRAQLASLRSRGRRSVAVFGFKNLSTRPDTAWISTALSEMLTTDLSLGGKIRTIPGGDVAQVKINLSLPEADSLSKRTLSQVYGSLGSDFVVVGSYLDVGDSDRSIRLDLHVQDAALGETVASIAETGNEAALPGLVSRAGVDLRAKLGVPSLSGAEPAQLQSAFTSNPEANRLFAEGIAKLRVFDALGARDSLEKALAADSSFALAHSALADAWLALGYPAKASEESKEALDDSTGLPREQSLFIEARYWEIAGQHDKAIDLYRTLFNFFPDNIDYGLRLAALQSTAGRPREALATVDKLRQLPPPGNSDPRIDLAEADATKNMGDDKAEFAAARRAEMKGRAQGARLLVAEALIAEGEAYTFFGSPQQSNAVTLAAQEIFKAVGDRFGESRALRNLGAVYSHQGDFVRAEHAFEESARIRHDLGNRAGEAASLSSAAGTIEFQKDFNRSEEMYLRSLAISRELGDTQTVWRTLGGLGGLETHMGKFTAARAHLEEALSLVREAGNMMGVGGISNNLGLLAFEQGDMVRAKQLLTESLIIARRRSEKFGVGGILLGLAAVAQTTGDLPSAYKMLAESKQVLKEAGNEGEAAYALGTIGTILFEQDDLTGARKAYQECLKTQEEQKEEGFAAETRLSLIRLAMEEHQSAEAETSLRPIKRRRKRCWPSSFSTRGRYSRHRMPLRV
jgi:eukaryotic-like serine/threonine-protein kinase